MLNHISTDIHVWLAALLIVIPVGNPWVKPIIALIMVLFLALSL